MHVEIGKYIWKKFLKHLYSELDFENEKALVSAFCEQRNAAYSLLKRLKVETS